MLSTRRPHHPLAGKHEYVRGNAAQKLVKDDVQRGQRTRHGEMTFRKARCTCALMLTDPHSSGSWSPWVSGPHWQPCCCSTTSSRCSSLCLRDGTIRASCHNLPISTRA